MATRKRDTAPDLDTGRFAQTITQRLARQNHERPASERDELNYPQPLRNKRTAK